MSSFYKVSDDDGSELELGDAPGNRLEIAIRDDEGHRNAVWLNEANTNEVRKHMGLKFPDPAVEMQGQATKMLVNLLLQQLDQAVEELDDEDFDAAEQRLLELRKTLRS